MPSAQPFVYIRYFTPNSEDLEENCIQFQGLRGRIKPFVAFLLEAGFTCKTKDDIVYTKAGSEVIVEALRKLKIRNQSLVDVDVPMPDILGKKRSRGKWSL